MTTSADKKSGNPLMQRIASHERSLLSRVAEARKAAQALAEEARAQARRLLEADERELALEAQRFRREADAARTAEYERTVRAAEAETEQDRAYVRAHVAEVAREVVGMILPGGSE